jgi:hypothetical protein
MTAIRQPTNVHAKPPATDGAMDHGIEIFLSQHPSDAERMEISVDSVIYQDGILDGPDVADRQGKINDQIKADKDVPVLLQKLKGAALKNKLAELSNTQPADHYSSRLSSLATWLQKKLDLSGEDAVLQDIEALKVSKWFPKANHVQRKVNE